MGEAVLPFTEHFEAVRLVGPRADWLERMRTAGLERYRRLGFPTRRTEQWKYTHLGRLTEIEFCPAPTDAPVDAGAFALPFAAHVATVVNGRFRPELSRLDDLPAGVTVASLGRMLEAEPDRMGELLGRLLPEGEMPLAALNAAMVLDGVVIRLRSGVVLDQPIHMRSIGHAGERPAVFHPRHLVMLEAGAQATLIETHGGEGDRPYFSNTVTEIGLGAGAGLRHYKIQEERPGAFHLAATGMRLHRQAAYEGFVLQLGGRLARHELHVEICAGDVDCRLAGAFIGAGEQVIDTTTLIDHACPGSRSRQVFKGVLDDAARGVYQGKVIVRRGATKTDAHQLSRALLLSRRAEMDAKPELEIYADDVKCGHGAAVGELEEDAVFYLESRGIDPVTARRILLEGFLAEVVTEISHPATRDAVTALLAGRLARLG